MEDRQIGAYIATLFFIAITAVPWIIIAWPVWNRVRSNGIWAAALPLATGGLIVGLASYALLYASFMIMAATASYQTGAAKLVGAATAVAVSYRMIPVAIETATSTGAAVVFAPCLSGITGGTVAIAAAAVMTLIQHIKSQTWANGK